MNGLEFPLGVPYLSNSPFLKLSCVTKDLQDGTRGKIKMTKTVSCVCLSLFCMLTALIGLEYLLVQISLLGQSNGCHKHTRQYITVSCPVGVYFSFTQIIKGMSSLVPQNCASRERLYQPQHVAFNMSWHRHVTDGRVKSRENCLGALMEQTWERDITLLLTLHQLH